MTSGRIRLAGSVLATSAAWVLLAIGPSVSVSTGQDPAVQQEVQQAIEQRVHQTMQDMHERTIEQTIAEYKPAWLPSRGELRGLVVVIHPVGGGSKDADQRARDTLGLLTAEHLFHLISKGGSKPILTRADDLPALGPAGPTTEALIECCREARGHLMLAIDFSAPPAGSASSDDPLAQALAKAAEAATVRSFEGLASVLPAVVVHLPMPGEDMPPGELRRVHIDRGEKLYRGLRAYVEAHRQALQGDRDKRWPASSNESDKPTWEDRDQQEQRRKFEAVRAIWPQGDLPLEKAAWFAGIFRRVSLSDRTAVYYDPKVRIDGRAVVIEGATNAPVLLTSLENAYKALGIKEVRSSMRLLPDEQKLGGELFGACIVPSALTFSQPKEGTRGETHLLYGEPVYMLDAENGLLLVQASDGYCGWVRRAAIKAMDREAFGRYMASPHGVLTSNLKTADGWILRGSRLPVRGVEGSVATVALPTGDGLDVQRGQVRLMDTRGVLERRALAALSMLYTPYVFAGRSPLGVDCSGLITNVCEEEGIPMARDAAQQFLSGKLVATAWYREGLQPGDRVYFIDQTGKIFHTGIAISPTHFVHSSSPGVKINSLRKGDPLYDEGSDRAFLGAKRP